MATIRDILFVTFGHFKFEHAHNEFKEMIKGDRVRIQGWRYRNITTLSFISIEPIYESIPHS